MSFSPEYNSANYNNKAVWLNEPGVTTVGTNGGPSYYGTEDQSGNVWEWTENVYDDEFFVKRGLMGGAFNTNSASISKFSISNINIQTKSSNIGLRLVSKLPHDNFANFVRIADLSNDPDPDTNLGNVEYEYYISQHPITNQQYVNFLNVVDPSGLNANNLYYSLSPSKKQSGILLDNSKPVSQKYYTKTYFNNKPVNYIDWKSCAMLCNWLHNGANANSDLFSGSYTINSNVISDRSISYLYAIPNENEWYKSAFYNPDTSSYYTYATQYNSLPCAVGDIDCSTAVNLNGDGSDPILIIVPTQTSVPSTPTPTQTSVPSTPTPTQTPVPSTPTPTPTQTPVPSTPTPTQTPVPSTPTPTPTPTQTPVPSTPTPTPSETPLILNSIQDDDTIDISDTTIQYNNLINNKYTIIKYPEEAEIVDLTSIEDITILNNFDTIFQTNQNETDGDLLFFNTVTSGNSYSPNPKSTLSKITPGETYFVIAKNTATYPITFPGFPDSTWFGKYINITILGKIKTQLKIESSYEDGGLPEDSQTKLLLGSSSKKISWAKLATSLYNDVKYYLKADVLTVNHLAEVLYDFQFYYRTYSLECIGLLNSIYEYCDSINLKGYVWNTLSNHEDNQLDPVIIIGADNNGSIKFNISAASSDILPIDLPVSGLNHQPNNKITYEFKIMDNSHLCEFSPSSGIISTNTTQDVIHFRTIFSFLE